MVEGIAHILINFSPLDSVLTGDEEHLNSILWNLEIYIGDDILMVT